jgi:hypothetical protein
MYIYLMRKTRFILLIAGLLLESCGSEKTSKADNDKLNSANKPMAGLSHKDSVELDFKSRIERIPLGDLNGDGIADTAIVSPPRFISPGNPIDGCQDDSCLCRIHFTCNLPDLTGVFGIGEVIANVGDLDNNGYCEISLVPEWFSSVWQALYVYGFRNGKWQLFGTGTCNLNSLDSDPDFFKNRVKKMDSMHLKIISDSLTEDSLLPCAKIYTIK